MANSPRRHSASAPLAHIAGGDTAAARERDAWAADMALEIPASRLTQGQRNAVWREIKAHHPDRRAFLEDPQVRALMAATGAEPMFPPDLVRAAVARQQQGTTA